MSLSSSLVLWNYYDKYLLRLNRQPTLPFTLKHNYTSYESLINYMLDSDKEYKICFHDKVDYRKTNVCFIPLHKKIIDGEIRYNNFNTLHFFKESINWCVDNGIHVIIDNCWERNDFSQHDYDVNVLDHGVALNSPFVHYLTSFENIDWIKESAQDLQPRILNSNFFMFFMRRMYNEYKHIKEFNYFKQNVEPTFNHSVVLGRMLSNKTGRLHFLKEYNKIIDKSKSQAYYLSTGRDVPFDDLLNLDNLGINSTIVPSYDNKHLFYDKSIPASFYHSKYNVHMETKLRSSKSFIFTTEKSYKIYLSRMPGFVIGTTGHNENLKQKLGFELYDDHIDYSFDAERNKFIRMEVAINEMKRLDNLPVSYFRDKSISDKLEHNFNHFKKITSRASFVEHLDSLLNQIVMSKP